MRFFLDYLMTITQFEFIDSEIVLDELFGDNMVFQRIGLTDEYENVGFQYFSAIANLGLEIIFYILIPIGIFFSLSIRSCFQEDSVPFKKATEWFYYGYPIRIVLENSLSSYIMVLINLSYPDTSTVQGKLSLAFAILYGLFNLALPVIFIRKLFKN